MTVKNYNAQCEFCANRIINIMTMTSFSNYNTIMLDKNNNFQKFHHIFKKKTNKSSTLSDNAEDNFIYQHNNNSAPSVILQTFRFKPF